MATQLGLNGIYASIFSFIRFLFKYMPLFLFIFQRKYAPIFSFLLSIPILNELS